MRYLKIYFSLVRFSIQRSLQFKIDFFIKIIMDCVFYAAQFLFFGVLMGHTNSLSGWQAHHVQMLVASVCVMDALQMTFFSANLWQFPMLVNTGAFDSYLLRPVSARFFTSLRSFQLDSFFNLLIAIGILGYVLNSSPEPVSWLRIGLYAIGICAGTFIFYCLFFTALCGVFWLQQVKGLTSLSFTFNRLSEYPDAIFPNVMRKVLVSVLPYSLISSFPARILFDTHPFQVLLHIFVGATFVFVVSHAVWRMGLRSYSSASS
jgi:ABC-2 type transport system permease protein